MKPGRRRIDVNLDELDKVLDGARQAPLSEADYDKLKSALHALAAMIVRPRPSERTSAVVEQTGAAEIRGTAADSEAPRSGHGRHGAQASRVPRRSPLRTRSWITEIAVRNAERETYTARKSRRCWSGLSDRRRWRPRFIRSSACAAALAGKYSPQRNRRAWVRKNTMRRRRQ